MFRGMNPILATGCRPFAGPLFGAALAPDSRAAQPFGSAVVGCDLSLSLATVLVLLSKCSPRAPKSMIRRPRGGPLRPRFLARLMAVSGFVSGPASWPVFWPASWVPIYFVLWQSKHWAAQGGRFSNSGTSPVSCTEARILAAREPIFPRRRSQHFAGPPPGPQGAARQPHGPANQPPRGSKQPSLFWRACAVSTHETSDVHGGMRAHSHAQMSAPVAQYEPTTSDC